MRVAGEPHAQVEGATGRFPGEAEGRAGAGARAGHRRPRATLENLQGKRHAGATRAELAGHEHHARRRHGGRREMGADGDGRGRLHLGRRELRTRGEARCVRGREARREGGRGVAGGARRERPACRRRAGHGSHNDAGQVADRIDRIVGVGGVHDQLDRPAQ